MRQFMTLVESVQRGFSGIVFHGSDETFRDFRIDPIRGVYFSGDENYARDYGKFVYRCRVSLDNPRVYSEDDANGDMEIDREALIGQGYDGRLVRYDNGDIDVIAFHRHQIEIVEFPKTLSESVAEWPQTLADEHAIADYIEKHASDDVDHGLIVDHFRGTRAVLRKVALAEIKPGHPDANVGDPAKTKRYMKMDPATMPPILIEDGVVVDGHHRYRVAKKLGLTEIWCYVIEDQP
jgi:hypothetical protein